MAYEAVGKIYKKMDTIQRTDTFRIRELILETIDGQYTQLIKFQLTQNNCEKLDGFNEGDEIKVTFSLRGREYTKDGRTSYFTNLDAWKIENAAAGGGQQAAVPAASENNFPSPDDQPTGGGSDSNDDLPF